MADGELVLTTSVDVGPLQAGMQQATAAITQFTTRASAGFGDLRAAESALSQAQEELGSSAAEGNEQAASIIAEYQAAVDNLRAALNDETDALVENTGAHEVNNTAVRSGISDRQVASASLRTLEGGIQGSTRAAGAFLTSVLGLGPALQVAFPVIGAIALVEVLAQIPKEIDKMSDALAGWNEQQKKIFDAGIAEATRLLNVYDGLAKSEADHAGAGQQGPSRIQSEIVAIGTYQQQVARTQVLVNELTAALNQAGGQSTKTIVRPRGFTAQAIFPTFEIDSVREKVDKQLEEFNALISTEATSKHLVIPAPITINWSASQSTVREQLSTLTDTMRAEAQRLAETQASTNQQKGSLAPEENETALTAAQRVRQAGLEADKQIAESRIALDEQTARREQELGQITSAQLVQELGTDAQKKLQVQLDYFSQLDAILAKDPSKNAAELTRNQGQIQALGIQQKTVAIKTAQDAQESEVKSALKGIDEEIAATKQGSAARIQLLQIEVAFAAAAWGESSAEYSHYIEELNTADREREAQYQKSLQKQIDETEKATEKMASDAEKAAERAYTAQQKSLDDLEKQNVQADVPQRRSRGRASGPLNLSTVEADAAAAKSAIDNWVADSEAAVNRLGQAVQDSLTVKLEAAKTALTETEANGGDSERYLAQIEELNDQVTANAQATQDKIDAVERKGADDRIAEERRVAQEKQQIDDQILNYTESITQSLLTRQRTAAETLLKTWEKVLTDLESYFTRTFERAIIESKQGQAAIGAISGGVSKVTSALGLGAAVKPGAGSGEMTSFNLALVKATPAIAALATAARAAASAENAEAPASRSVAVAKAAEAPAVTQATAAQVVQAPAVHASTAAHAVHAPTVGASTVAHVINAGATTTDATSSVVHTGAVNADTLATIAHKIAQFFGFAEGGEIRGAGSPRSDSVPIMASPGEFMVNADAVSKPGMLAHLHAINSGRRELSRLHFADGGFVTAANLNDIAPTAPALALHIQNMNAAASERSSQARFDPAEMAGDRTAPRGGGDEGNDQHNLNLHYHDRRSLSAVDTHGLHDLMGKDPRQASNLFKGLLRSGHLTMKDLLK